MFGVSFGLFGVIFLLMFVFVVFNIIRTFSRVHSMQNRVFDAVEKQLDQPQNENDHRSERSPRDYNCDQCGAALGDNADVSPSGDFKCSYCGKWSNIHQG